MVRDAYPYLYTLGGASIILALIGLAGLELLYIPATILALLALFVAWFFRNPEREIPTGNGVVVSPADGLVLIVRKIDLGSETVFGSGTGSPNRPALLEGEGTLVTIFLSVFDVHVNRTPIEGRIIRTEYRPGKFLVASLEKASQLNEQQVLAVSNSELTIVFRMIAGLIARRIVLWKGQGAELTRGERVGMIKFGSRVDLLLPPEVQVLVKKGQRVKGGSSIIGKVEK